jgi:hypothetical protein
VYGNLYQQALRGGALGTTGAYRPPEGGYVRDNILPSRSLYKASQNKKRVQKKVDAAKKKQVKQSSKQSKSSSSNSSKGSTNTQAEPKEVGWLRDYMWRNFLAGDK